MTPELNEESIKGMDDMLEWSKMLKPCSGDCGPAVSMASSSCADVVAVAHVSPASRPGFSSEVKNG